MWPNMQQSWGAAAASPMLFPGADATPESLVEQIKQVCRSDPNSKQQWVAFTDVQGGGKRDPAKHTPEFLQDFLTHLASGGRLEPNPEADLSKAIKVLQKQSGPQFRQSWSNFCMMAGGGKNDPSKHDGAFHLQFFEAVSQQAIINSGGTPPSGGNMGGGMGGMGGMAGPMGAGMKRDASAMLGMGFGGGFGGGGGGTPKDDLVNRMKAFQRSSAENKELWNTYCDTYLGGVKDPNRHDEGTLKEFCDNHGVPAASDIPGPQQAMIMDPAKEMYVNKVKQYTKTGPEGKENWLSFCGSTKDPARHPIEKLQEFVAAFAL